MFKVEQLSSNPTVHLDVRLTASVCPYGNPCECLHQKEVDTQSDPVRLYPTIDGTKEEGGRQGTHAEPNTFPFPFSSLLLLSSSLHGSLSVSRNKKDPDDQ